MPSHPRFPVRQRNRELLEAFFALGRPNEEGDEGAPIAFSPEQRQKTVRRLEDASGSQQNLENFFLSLDTDNPLFDSFASSRESRNTRRLIQQRRGFASTILTGQQTGLPGAAPPRPGPPDEFPLGPPGILDEIDPGPRPTPDFFPVPGSIDPGPRPTPDITPQPDNDDSALTSPTQQPRPGGDNSLILPTQPRRLRQLRQLRF